MNKSHRSIWNEALGAWVAASETAKARGKPTRTRADAAHSPLLGALLLALAGMATPAWADFSQNGAPAAFCARQGSGPATGSWTCQVPNGSGGFATVGGVPDDGSGTQPNYTTLTNWVASKLGANAIVLGSLGTSANGANAVALGTGAQATGDSSIATGNGAIATSTNEAAVAIGKGAVANGTSGGVGGAVAIGTGTQATGSGAIAMGTSAAYPTVASGTYSVALGINAQATSLGAVAVGQSALANNQNVVAIGANAGSNYTGSYADIYIGNLAGAQVTPTTNPTGDPFTGSVMIGDRAGAFAQPGTYNAFLGYAAGRSAKNGGLGIGENTAIGAGAFTNGTGDLNVVMGQSGQGLTGSNNTYLGGLGAGSQTRGSDNIGLGSLAGAASTGSRNIALGSKQDGSYYGDTSTGSADIAGRATGGAVIGDDNIALGTGTGSNIAASRTVAAGTKARATADDAIALGTGAVASGTQSISIGTGNVVSGANSGAIGDPSNVSGSGSYSVGNNNTIAQNNTFVLGNGVTTTQANGVVLGNASADKAAVQVSNASIPSVIATTLPDGTVSYSAGPNITYGNFAGTAVGVVSVGAAGAERQIVNLAPGAISATSTDAVNGSQLYSVASQVSALGGSVTTIVNNASSHFYSVNGGTNADGNYANNGATAQGAIASGIGATASATNAVAMGTNASATTANSVALGASSTTGATTSTTGTNIRGTSYTFAGGTSTGVVSVGSVGGERQVTNVAAGQLNASSTDAVNGSQLYATNQAINNIAIAAGAGINVTTAQTGTGIAIGTSVANVGPGGTATYTAGNNMVLTQNGTNTSFAVNDNPNFTSVTVGGTSITANGMSIANGPSMTTAGVNAGGKTITNVAPGVNGTDAVNVNQLNTGVAASMAYTSSQVNQLNNALIQVGKKAYSGTAAAMAMESAPMVAGKLTYSAGMGYYEGQSAVGATLRKTSDSGRWSLTGGVAATSGGTFGIRVGVSGIID